MLAAGVDEHGTPLLEARDQFDNRIVDEALFYAAERGDVQAVELLLGGGATVVHVEHAQGEKTTALLAASENGHADVVQLLLLQHGTSVCLEE